MTLDAWLRDVQALRATGWECDDIASLSPQECSVLAHIARLPDGPAPDFTYSITVDGIAARRMDPRPTPATPTVPAPPPIRRNVLETAIRVLAARLGELMVRYGRG